MPDSKGTFESQLGRPIESSAKPIERTPETERLFGWGLSEEAKQEIAEIERHAQWF